MFLSAVFCEIIVTINVLKGSLSEVVHFGDVKVSSVRRIFSARFFDIDCSTLENNK